MTKEEILKRCCNSGAIGETGNIYPCTTFQIYEAMEQYAIEKQIELLSWITATDDSLSVIDNIERAKTNLKQQLQKLKDE